MDAHLVIRGVLCCLIEGTSNVGVFMPALRTDGLSAVTDGPGFALLTHLRQKRLELEGNVVQLSLILFAIEMCHEGKKEKHARITSSSSVRCTKSSAERK